MIFDLKDGSCVVFRLSPFLFSQVSGFRVIIRVRILDKLIPECVINDLSQDFERGKHKLPKSIHIFLKLDERPTIMDSAGSFRYTDQEIIEQLRQSGIDKRRSEEQLFNRFAYFIREGMTKHALSEDESFNAYSDTILAALENIKNTHFEARASLKTYLYQIFHNKCVDLLRKRTTNKNSVHRPETISDRLMHIIRYCPLCRSKTDRPGGLEPAPGKTECSWRKSAGSY